MRKIIPLFLAASLLVGACSTASDDPAPPPPVSLQGTWSITARRHVVTPKNGGAATTSDQPVTPGSITVTYGANGNYQSAFNGVVQSTGTYSVSGTYLTVTTSSSLTSTISELTASRLVTTTEMEDSANRYDFIDTYAR